MLPKENFLSEFDAYTLDGIIRTEWCIRTFNRFRLLKKESDRRIELNFLILFYFFIIFFQEADDIRILYES